MHKNTIETNCTVAQIIVTYIFHCYCYYFFYFFYLCPLLLSSLLIYNPNSKKVRMLWKMQPKAECNYLKNKTGFLFVETQRRPRTVK